MSTHTVIKKQQNKAKARKLVHHLSVGMSLISDETVRGALYEGIDVPAATGYMKPRSGYFTSKGRKDQGTFTTTFNPTMLPIDKVQVWLGIAWHELGHILWSPYRSNQVSITVALNLLEDARIETLILLKYPKMRAALMSALLSLLEMGEVNTTDDAAYSYAWVAGRGHLSKDVRNRARKMLVDIGGDHGKHVANEIDAIFREYLSMGSELDIKKAVDLANQLEELLGTSKNLDPGCAGSMYNGAQDSSKTPDVEVGQDTLDEVGSDDEDDTGNASSSKGEGEDTQSGKGAGGDEEIVPRPSLTDRALTDELREYAKEDIAEQADDISEELKEEVSRLEQLIDVAGGNQGVEVDVQVTPPMDSDKQLANGVRNAAIKFNDESAKGLVRRRDHGRFKPGRFERYDDLDTAYDQWEPGLDQEMYIALLIDNSGSMNRGRVSRVLYALEVGLADIATTDIALFSTTVTVPGARNSNTKFVNIHTHGGTSPDDGFTYLYPRIRRASAINKLLVLYTDGTFNQESNYTVANAYIGQLKSEGVNVRVIVESDGDAKAMQSKVKSLDKSGELVVLPGVEELPDIVLDWTRTVLTKGVL